MSLIESFAGENVGGWTAALQSHFRDVLGRPATTAEVRELLPRVRSVSLGTGDSWAAIDAAIAQRRGAGTAETARVPARRGLRIPGTSSYVSWGVVVVVVLVVLWRASK